MSAPDRSRSRYVLGPISLGHNTEKTLNAVRQQLSEAGEVPNIELESLRHGFYASKKHVKEVCCRMHGLLPGMSEADKSGQVAVDDDSMNAGQILAECQKQDEASVGVDSWIRPTLKSCIQQRQTLQETARKIFDKLLVIRPGHPSWGESAGRNVHVISASTLPQEKADFEHSWRLSVSEEQSYRELLQQECSREFLRLLSARENGQPWSMPDQKSLCGCVQSLWKSYRVIHSKSEKHSELLAGPPVIDHDKDGQFVSNLPALTGYGSIIVQSCAFVAENGEYTEEDRSAACVTHSEADTRDELAGEVSS